MRQFPVPDWAAKCFSAVLLVLLPFFFSGKAFAYCENGCDCCRCPNGMGECLNGYPSCEAACGLVGGTNQNQVNWWRWQQYQRQLQIQQQQIEEERLKREKRKKELDEQVQTEANSRKKENEEKNQAFIRQRNATTLKGEVGGEGLGLKGGVVDTGIKDLKPEGNVRDLGGAGDAWKQLNCAAYISGGALAALSQKDPDFSGFDYLAGEAVTALDGGRLGVQCPSAPPMPGAYGKGGYESYQARYKAALEHARKLAKDMENTHKKRKKALRRLIKAKEKVIKLSLKPDSKMKDSLERLKQEQRRIDAENAAKMDAVRQKQREINKENEKKADQMKSAMAAALEAMRKAQAAYNKETAKETRDLTGIGTAMKAGGQIAAGTAQ